MASINDWAAKAAKKIVSEQSNSEERVAAIIALYAEEEMKPIRDRESTLVEAIRNVVAGTVCECPNCQRARALIGEDL